MKKNIKPLCAALLARGILIVHINYNGADDDGSIKLELCEPNAQTNEPVITEEEQAVLLGWAAEAVARRGGYDWTEDNGWGTASLHCSNLTASIEHTEIVLEPRVSQVHFDLGPYEI